MNRFLRSLAIVGSLTLPAGWAYATPCDSSTDCENPASNGTAASWTATATGVSGVQAQNSVGPTGNIAGSQYHFAASTTDLGATTAKGSITTSGTGSSVIGSFATASSGVQTSAVVGGVVNNLLGAQAYFFYAEACPASAALDSGHCSVWVRVGSKSTSAYPISVFSAPVAPSDATTVTISARTNVPASDVTSISTINLEIDDITNSGTQTLSPIGWPGSNGTLVIDDSEYTSGSGFIPNTKYQYKGQVVYPYGVAVPTGGLQTEGPIWTTPVQPGTVSAFAVTHCSVKMDAQNAGGSPTNPNYTHYNLCAVGTSGSCTNQLIGGALATDLTSTGTITGLAPNTAYTTTAQALVGNGSDATANSWNNSVTKAGPGFTTLDWSPTSGVNTITTTGATYTITIGNTAGLTGYEIFVNGASNGGLQSAPVPASVTLTGLTPNTSYTVGIVLHEATCASSQLANQTFTTDADVPTGFGLAIVSPTQLTASWARAGNPSSGVTYKVQYCTDAGFTLNCLTPTTTALTLALTGLTPETTYYGHVLAETVGGGLDSAYSGSDFKMTPNAAPTLAAVTTTVWITSATLTTSSTDNGGPSHLVFVWAASAGGTLTSTAGTSSTVGGTVTNTTQVIFTGSAPANGTVFVFDHDHDLSSQMLSNNTTWTTSTARRPNTLSISPGTITIGTGQTTSFNVTIYDQFGSLVGNQIVGATATWTVSSPTLGTVSPNQSTFTILTAGGTLGTFGITATAGVATGSATVTVTATAPHFTSGPSAVVYLTTATFTAQATSINGPSSIVYLWAVQSGPAGAPLVDIVTNNANSATISTATFHKAGLYTVRCTITDTTAGFGGSTFADIPVTVAAVLNSTLTVTPSAARVQTGANQQFTATGIDQFTDPFTLSSVAWSVVGGGTINPTTGIFSDTMIGDNVTVHAQSGTSSGSATAVVYSFDVSGAYAYPVPYKGNAPAITSDGKGVEFKGLGSSASIDIYTPSGRKVFSMQTSSNKYLWPVKNSSGENVASGVYFYHIESPGGKKDGKLIIIQ